MAKRTNKTDHVLNLLAGSAKQEDTEETVDNKAKPPVDPLAKMNTNVSVHHTADNGETMIAETVKQNLEKELLENSAPKEIEVPEPQSKVIMKEENTDVVSEEPVIKTAPLAEENGETMQDTVSEETVSEETENISQQALPKEETAERDFEFVNVMECLVRDQVKRYMKQFGNCMCERCVEDVTALSLSHLPAKCVVVNKAAVSPLLNFYTKKYAGQITVEVTKSCIVVQDNPNH